MDFLGLIAGGMVLCGVVTICRRECRRKPLTPLPLTIYSVRRGSTIAVFYKNQYTYPFSAN